MTLTVCSFQVLASLVRVTSLQYPLCILVVNSAGIGVVVGVVIGVVIGVVVDPHQRLAVLA